MARVASVGIVEKWYTVHGYFLLSTIPTNATRVRLLSTFFDRISVLYRIEILYFTCMHALC